MSDWTPGDLALCVTARWDDCTNQRIPFTPPRRGSIHSVLVVDYQRVPGQPFLLLATYESFLFDATGFRKIRSLSDEEHRQAEDELRETRREVVRAFR